MDRDLTNIPPFREQSKGYDLNTSASVLQRVQQICSRPDPPRPQKPIYLSRLERTNPERARIATRLNGFNPKDNAAWTALGHRFGTRITKQALLKIAGILAVKANVPLDRDAKPRKTVLLKWFLENWASLSPFLDYLVYDVPEDQF
jgi:hypothetical protein